MNQVTLSDKKTYNLSADILRVIAICGVVTIHTANSIFARSDFFGGSSWWFAIAINSASRISIPLFIMISGYFLLSKNETIHETWRRAWHRIGIPLLFWFVVYVMWNDGRPSLDGINLGLAERLLTVNVFDLYFLIILGGLYAASPLLRSLLREKKDYWKRRFSYGAVLLGMALYIVQFAFGLCSFDNAITYWIPYVGLFIAGYVLGHSEALTIRRWQIVAMFLAGFIITVVGGYGYFLLKHQGIGLLEAGPCLNHYTDSYLSINVVMMTIAVFVFVMRANFLWLPQLMKSAIYSIARSAFGIYILHVIVLSVFDFHLELFRPIAPLWLHIVLKWTMVFLVSYIATVILLRVPFVRKAFGEHK